MAYNPYAGGGGYLEDEYNAIHGQYSPESILNSINQSQGGRPPGGSPYDAMLSHSINFRPMGGPDDPFMPRRGVAPQAPSAPTDPYEPQMRLRPPATQPPAGGGRRRSVAQPQNPPPPPATQPAPATLPPGGPDLSALIGGIISGMGPKAGATPPTNPAAAAMQNLPPIDPSKTPALTPVPGPAAPTAQFQPTDDYLANLNRALSESQRRQTDEAMRQYRSAAGAVGMENTGAYLPGMADVIGNLSSQFERERSEAMLGVSEAERGRGLTREQNEFARNLERYGIDVNSYTSRFNTTTQAGIQQAAQAMQYDLGLRGIQVDQARLEEVIRNNTLGYNLGVGQQNLQRYISGNQNQIDLFELLARYGPESLFVDLFGPQLPPGMTYTP